MSRAMFVRVSMLAGAAIVVSIGAVAALQNPPATPQQQPPTFRGTTNLVLVDAYPHNKDGRVVEGLTAEDFQVLEDGKPQKVESFEFVRIETGLSESERRDPNNTREMLALAADPHNRVFVVFLDALHVTLAGSHELRRPLVDALNRIIGPNDLFGVVTQNHRPIDLVLGRRLMSVEEQLTKYWPWGERQRLSSDPTDPVEDELKRCFGDRMMPDGPVMLVVADVLIERRRADRTLTALENMVGHLATLREARSMLLLVSDGWVISPSNLALQHLPLGTPEVAPPVGILNGKLTTTRPVDGTGDALGCNSEFLRLASIDFDRRQRDLINVANRSNVSFYPIDPQGLVVFDNDLSRPVIPNKNSEPSRDGTILTREFDRVKDRTDSLRVLAENTGGVAVVQTNDLGAGLKKIVDDVSAYYLLGYYSTNTRNDGGIRRIEVKMRPAGLTVSARRGYRAPDARAEARAVNAAATAATPAAPPGMDEALGVLSRLRPNGDLFTYGVARDAELQIVVELAGRQLEMGGWANGGKVQVKVTGAAGEAVGEATGAIEPGARGVTVRVPVTGDGPWHVSASAIAGAQSVDDRADVRVAPVSLLGAPLLYRATPSPRSVLRPVADFQYRRTERAHVEWPIAKPLDQRTARVLDRRGQPLPLGATVTEREVDGKPQLAVDVNLAPLSEGDYLIEVNAGAGATADQKIVAIRVVR